MITILTALVGCGAPAPDPSPVEAAAHAAAPMAEQITVTGLRARAMPPGAPNTGAFMTLHNGGQSEIRLVSARADVSRKVELHTHLEEDGMMKMRRVPEIVIPAGADVVLQPGGLHVMFIGLTSALPEGHTFPLTLDFADGSSLELVVPVQKIDLGDH